MPPSLDGSATALPQQDVWNRIRAMDARAAKACQVSADARLEVGDIRRERRVRNRVGIRVNYETDLDLIGAGLKENER